jgi:DNA (cytosine-5)-methyltransferase 1
MVSNPNSSQDVPTTVRPVAIDLFSGAGGLSLGFEQAGFDIVAAVEYDPVHAATHLFNFPQCEVLCRDASKLTADMVLAAAKAGFHRLQPKSDFPEQIDAIVGGPPCQGFSTGGKRQKDDERNDLLLEYVKLVTEIKPRTFCLENVAGLLETKFDGVREEALKRLRAVGYALSGTDKPLNSLDFGVPQTRRRVIILGSIDGKAPTRPVGASLPLSVSEAFEGLPTISAYRALLASDVVTLTQGDKKRRRAIKGSYARQLAGLEPIPGDRSRPRTWSPELLTNSRRTAHEGATVQRFNGTEPGTVEPKSRLYRLPLDGPSRTLRAGTGAERGAHTSPRPIHPTEDRVITVREAARLHGYPDWFRFHTTNWHGHRQVGNSVPPPLARAAAIALLDSLGRKPAALRAAVPLGDVSLLSLSRTKAQPIVKALDGELPPTRTHPVAAKPVEHEEQQVAR